MTAVCEDFGISRKTGYKIFERYKDAGLVGLTDHSRRPHRHANQLPMAVERLIVRLRQEYPHWGPQAGWSGRLDSCRVAVKPRGSLESSARRMS
jgi:transposase